MSGSLKSSKKSNKRIEAKTLIDIDVVKRLFSCFNNIFGKNYDWSISLTNLEYTTTEYTDKRTLYSALKSNDLTTLDHIDFRISHPWNTTENVEINKRLYLSIHPTKYIYWDFTHEYRGRKKHSTIEEDIELFLNELKYEELDKLRKYTDSKRYRTDYFVDVNFELLDELNGYFVDSKGARPYEYEVVRKDGTKVQFKDFGEFKEFVKKNLPINGISFDYIIGEPITIPNSRIWIDILLNEYPKYTINFEAYEEVIPKIQNESKNINDIFLNYKIHTENRKYSGVFLLVYSLVAKRYRFHLLFLSLLFVMYFLIDHRYLLIFKKILLSYILIVCYSFFLMLVRVKFLKSKVEKSERKSNFIKFNATKEQLDDVNEYEVKINTAIVYSIIFFVSIICLSTLVNIILGFPLSKTLSFITQFF